MAQRAHLHAVLHVAIAVHRRDSLHRRSELFFAEPLLLVQILQLVKWETDACAIGDFQILRTDVHTLAREILNFVRERFEIDDRSGTDDVGDARVEDAGGDKAKRELAAIVDDCVSCVVPALIPHHAVCVLREVIDHAAFALIAPVAADHDPNGHSFSFEPSHESSHLHRFTRG